MSMTNQEILDHTARYLFNRINNQGGRLVKGWYNLHTGDSGDRCALGDLADANCIGVDEISRSACYKMNGYVGQYTPRGVDFPSIALNIMNWNDNLSIMPITLADAHMMLNSLAMSYNLNLDVWNTLINKVDQPAEELEEFELDDDKLLEDDKLIEEIS